MGLPDVTMMARLTATITGNAMISNKLETSRSKILFETEWAYVEALISTPSFVIGEIIVQVSGKVRRLYSLVSISFAIQKLQAPEIMKNKPPKISTSVVSTAPETGMPLSVEGMLVCSSRSW